MIDILQTVSMLSAPGCQLYSPWNWGQIDITLGTTHVIHLTPYYPTLMHDDHKVSFVFGNDSHTNSCLLDNSSCEPREFTKLMRRQLP